ncbi:hypothetical protein L1C83_27175, partial [Klebsiella pneumoniae]|uniref:hypothetical protein n=1 Tax=Klebsiella pneumoniae TaxID=573 RepID=UPI0020CCDF5C
FGFAENTDDLFVGKTLLHGDVLMWLMKTLLTSGCTNQRGAGHVAAQCSYRCQLDSPWAAKKLIGKQQITQKQKAQSFDWAFCFI